MLTVYGIRNCDTMKKAFVWLAANGIAYDFVDYKKAGVVAAHLPDWNRRAGWQALLYAGLVSVGIGYTLQVVGQRGAHPAHAAIILSLETVFAAIGGVLLLGEHLDERAVVGCALMLAGMLISQIRLRWWWKSRRNKVPSQP
jgi:drug/metabolite transporter (DMT)-like permease